MKVIVIGGMLGSGKTTLIKRMIEHLKKQPGYRENSIAVIQNEDGEVKLSAEEGLEVDSLTGGCICCTLTAGLGDMLAELRKNYDPDYVLVEASGNAVIEKVSGTVREYMPEIRACRGLVLCDASEYRENMDSGLDVFLTSQLRSGDAAVLSKCDRLPRQDAEDIRAELASLLQGKEIFMFSDRGTDDALLEKMLGGKAPKRINYLDTIRKK